MNRSFWGFLVALTIVTLPAWLMEQSGNDKWAWRYAFVVLLMMLVVNTPAITQLLGFSAAAARS